MLREGRQFLIELELVKKAVFSRTCSSVEVYVYDLWTSSPSFTWSVVREAKENREKKMARRT